MGGSFPEVVANFEANLWFEKGMLANEFDMGCFANKEEKKKKMANYSLYRGCVGKGDIGNY